MRNYIFSYSWAKYDQFNTGMIPARSFKSAMKKLEKIYKDSPFEVTLFDSKKLPWKVRT